MNKIIFPMELSVQGPSVADLQDGLRLLLDRNLLLRDNEDARRELAQALKQERERQTFADATAKLVGIFQKEHELPATGDVDEQTASALNDAISHEEENPPEFQYLVRGQVLYSGGLPIPGLMVRAFHRELRKEIELGAKKTDENGNFEIYFNPNRIEALAKVLNDRPPDVFVRVYEAVPGLEPNEKVLIESATRFSAQRVVKFRLRVDGGPTKTWSEYEQLTQELKPYLADLPIADLVEDKRHQDVTLLAGKLAQPPGRVAAFIAAHKMAAEVNGNPEVFYALARKGLPTNLSELLAVPPGTRSRALVAAIREGLAPGTLVGQVRKIREQFDEHAVTFAAADKETAGRARLGAVLKSAIPDQDKVDALVAKVINHTGPTAKLWETLKEDPQLKEVVPDAQLTLQLTALTGRHLPLVRTLLEQQREQKFTSVTDFAALSENDWLAFINTAGVPEAERVPQSIPGKDAEEKAKIYAATIARIVADTMPTQVLAYKAQTNANQPADIKTFWENVTSGVAGFELGRGRVRNYLDKNPALLQGIGDKEAVIGHLEETQRLFNLTRSYDEQQVLRSAGLNSSLAVTRLGQGTFLQRMSGTGVSPQNAVMIYEKAARVSAAALDLVTQYSPAFNTLAPRVLDVGFHPFVLPSTSEASLNNAIVSAEIREAFVSQNINLSPNAQVVVETPSLHWSIDDGAYRYTVMMHSPVTVTGKQIPNLETLFGTFNLCGCDQCRSVHSPAAYFADLLAYLGDRPSTKLKVPGDPTKGFKTARDILFERRPDLGEIELTCTNTNTVLPYTDLANEILEQRIAPFAPFNLPAAAEGELNSKTISPAVRAAFASKQIELSPAARAVVGAPSTRWSITDGSVLYSIVKSGAAVSVNGAWPQTGASAASLAAVPEHVNSATYTVLRDEAYPWILPLHMPTEEIRVFLGHLGTPRHELMGELFAGGPIAALDDVATAAEYLGLSDAERRCVTNTVNPARQPWEYWGLQQNGNTVTVFDPVANAFADKPLGWLDALGWVRQVLRRSGLEYDELVRVLGCEFVNPNLVVRIVSADSAEPATCDTAKLILTNVTPVVADKLTRFVRLWRKIGGEPEDLDGILVALCGSQLDDPAILKLSHVTRLSAAFGRSVSELLALWTLIPTQGRDPLFQSLFLNPDVLTPVDSAFALGAGNELAIVASNPAEAKVSKHAPPILAALRISAADLAALKDAGIASNDNLTLANLSGLYRHALLARCLELSIPDLLSLKSIAGIDPFALARTADTQCFVDLVAKVQQSGLEIGDLGYLLFHLSPDIATLAPPSDATAELIAEVRRQLRVVRDATATRPDPAGDNLRRELASLRWPAGMIDDAIAALGGTERYSAALNPVPPGFAVPAAFTSRLSHDPIAKTLSISGSLTSTERDTLKAAFATANYKAAIEDLFAQPRTFAQTRMRAYSWPIVSAPLAALPAGLTFPPALRGHVNYDPAAQVLSFDGSMNAADKSALDALSTDAAYRAATGTLLVAANAFVPSADNQFITAVVANALFDQALPADRFAATLGMVLARRRTSEGTRLVVRQVADAVGMRYRIAERLLTRDLAHPTAAGKKGIDAYLEDPFAASSIDVAPTEAAFPAAFEITLRMMKIAGLVRAMRLSDRLVDWLSDFAGTVPARPVPWGGGVTQAKWLALTELPAKPEAIDPVRFAAWVRLFDLGRVGSGLPGGEATAEAIFAEARKPGASIATRLATLTGWESSELTALAGAIGLVLPRDTLDEFGLTRLRDMARRLGRLSTNTVQAKAWAAAAPAPNAGIAARQAVQASYAADQWPDAIRPLEEKLREKRRAALVPYLVVRPDAGKREAWTDTNGMYSHLLIDVETHPVVFTSRLKQAIGSTQLFVQRCLMNLEPDVIADESDIGWRQWPWMKQFRVWEANRKIFLYPENWVEPELRDDKSPFFLELENALLQSDITSESAEQAYISYLARLDEVARLEVAGVFHQPGEGGAPDEYHVFARTHVDPPTYFYRKWVGQARWTPWQRLDLDIPSGQILPLIWNRRLYLFWPLFTRKAAKPTIGDKPVEGKPYFEIQLAWSEYRQGRWGPKKTTPSDATIQSVLAPFGDSPDDGRRAHVFRATVSGVELRIWYELPTSKPQQVNKYGQATNTANSEATSGWFFSGCNGRITLSSPFNIGVYPPPNTYPEGMQYVELATDPMTIPSDDFPMSDGSLQLPSSSLSLGSSVVLRQTPGAQPFRLTPPHQDPNLTGNIPFFFHDQAETLLIVPREELEWIWVWTRPERIDPKIIDIIDHIYYQPDPIPDPIGPIAERWDPVPVIRYQYEAATAGAIAQVAEAMAKPIVPALATGKLALASEARKAQLMSIKGTKERELAAIGDRKMVTISDYLSSERMFQPDLLGGYSVTVRRYEFRTHYHPYVCPMIRELNLSGLDGLLQRRTQLPPTTPNQPFKSRYGPTASVEMGDPAKKDKYPIEDVDFDFDGAYAGYNWELFFHVPLLIACKLMQNQRFEEAQKWFHAIFDPTDVSSAAVPAKYWRTRPFYEQQDYLKQRIDKLLEALAKGIPDEDLSRQLSDWVANPFKPFAVARVRTVAFQKTVVMKYLDNLIAWGDQLFRRDTIESINEATQLYILAAEILGPRPPVIAPRATPVTHTFNTLAPQFAALTNELTDIEAVLSSPRVDSVLASPDSPPLPVPQLLYFCVPPNDKLLKYWDTVADRLFKIRNSLNLAGIRRTLPLFEPPIDPMLLVKAAAAGVDLSTAIADLAAPAPLYRFQILVPKAVELCQDVKALGGALLGALERRDAEELSRIQAVHEVALLKRVSSVKEDQIKEAKAQITALQAARELAAERYRHYMTLLGASPTVPAEGTAPADAEAVAGASTLVKDGIRLIAQESTELSEMANAADAEQAASNWDALANVGSLIPAFGGYVTPWGIGVQTAYGGEHIGPALSAIANLWRSSAADHRHKAQKASRLAEFIMRAHNWKLEANLASREVARIDKDLAVARVREAISTKERDNHVQQIEENEKVEEFLRTKYTNRELYDWMIGQISSVYFQAYQLAYDTGRRAERAFRRELAVPDTDYVRFGYWDSLRKGLLAGDRLLHDIRRMEVAYLDQNAREYEITKNVSLGSIYPEGLLALQEKGACFIDLPEALFDLDHAGQYLRRIKAVNVTIPCVTGPYTSVPCKLTLLANRTRVDPRPTPQYALTGPDDQRFEFNSGGVRSVVTSNGRDDPGAFEFNLRDERYLPFEGAGVISSWRLELPGDLPTDFRPFDYRTISDVILHVRYTAREGGETLRDAATKKLADALKAMEVDRGRAGLFRGFSGRHEFPDGWQAFAHMPDGQAGNNVLSLPIVASRFPAFTSGRSVKITRILVALVPAPGIAYDDNDLVTLTLTPPTGAAQALTLKVQPNRAGGLPVDEIALPAPALVAAHKPGDPAPTPWKVEVTHISANLARTVSLNGVNVDRIDAEKVIDVVVVFAYTV